MTIAMTELCLKFLYHLSLCACAKLCLYVQQQYRDFRFLLFFSLLEKKCYQIFCTLRQQNFLSFYYETKKIYKRYWVQLTIERPGMIISSFPIFEFKKKIIIRPFMLQHFLLNYIYVKSPIIKFFVPVSVFEKPMTKKNQFNLLCWWSSHS